MPLVTVITPVYNAARLLHETIASVQAQTFTGWEHLLVNDGSTDNSAGRAGRSAEGYADSATAKFSQPGPFGSA